MDHLVSAQFWRTKQNDPIKCICRNARFHLKSVFAVSPCDIVQKSTELYKFTDYSSIRFIDYQKIYRFSALKRNQTTQYKI
jgi:hypothetical protein